MRAFDYARSCARLTRRARKRRGNDEAPTAIARSYNLSHGTISRVPSTGA
jgi:hypothetical protein